MRNRPINLLLVAHYFPLRGSGVFRAQDFVRFLEPLGVNVSVISRMNLSDVMKVRAEENLGKTKVYRALSLNVDLGELVLDMFQMVATFMVSFIAMVADDINVVLISVPPGIPAVGAFLAGKVLRKKIVLDVRDKWEDHSIFSSRYALSKWTHRILKYVFTVFYRKSNLVIGVTPSLVEHLKARGSSNAVHIPNGADVKLFYPRTPEENLKVRSELGLAAENIVLVFAGGMGTGGYYRPDVVIQALGNLGHELSSKMEFVIIGKSDEQLTREIRNLTKNLKLQENVVLLGELKRDDVARILPCCDVGIIPYDDNPLWSYAQPAKLFDYCASGLPIIATTLEGSDLAVIIENNKIGYVTRPLDVASLASALRSFSVLSQTERKEMQERARNLVINSFDRLKTAEKLMATLQSV